MYITQTLTRLEYELAQAENRANLYGRVLIEKPGRFDEKAVTSAKQFQP